MFVDQLNQHIDAIRNLARQEDRIVDIGDLLARAVGGGGKILICGNGGSAADAQHFAAELIGRFERERRACPAIALTTDTSILTAIANDYQFDRVFARQIEGIGQAGDVLIGISTSGNSANVIAAAHAARALGITTIALLGGRGGALRDTVDRAVLVDAGTTARIQEAHIFILHFWASCIERGLPPR